MKNFLYHLKIEFNMGLRDKSILFMNYLFPLGFFFFIGNIMGKLQPDFKEQMIPSMIIFSIMAATILSIPNLIVSSRDNGVYRSYKIYGVSRLQIISLITISTLFHILISSIIIYFLSKVFFNANIPENPLYLVLICGVFAFVNLGLSILIGVCSNNSRVTTLWAQLIFIPSVMIGGLMLPIKSMPESLKTISKLIPSTYAMNSINNLAMGTESLKGGIPSSKALIILFIMAVLSYILSYRLFKWDNKNKEGNKDLIAALIFLPLILAALFI